jgi:hypothetical protein
MFVKQLAKQSEWHSESREFERRDRPPEVEQTAPGSGVENSQRTDYVQTLSLRGDYALAIIHQQQVRTELNGQCDRRGFPLVNTGRKRDCGRVRDFNPCRRCRNPSFN